MISRAKKKKQKLKIVVNKRKRAVAETFWPKPEPNKRGRNFKQIKNDFESELDTCDFVLNCGAKYQR